MERQKRKKKEKKENEEDASIVKSAIENKETKQDQPQSNYKSNQFFIIQMAKLTGILQLLPL